MVEEGLGSPSERVSSGVGNDGDKIRLTQPGKSDFEGKPFLRLRGDDNLGLVLGSRLLTEFTQTADVPSVPLFSGSESFSPSVFMSVDTMVGVSTFGGVTKLGDTQGRPLNLRSRSSISIPSHYLNPVTLTKSKRVDKRVADVLVRLFFSDSLVIHCGGKMSRGVNIQVCVAPASSCPVSSHATKAETFESNRLYIMTPSKSGRVKAYLDPSVSTTDMSKEMVNFLLAQEFPVKFWFSLLPRTLSCTV